MKQTHIIFLSIIIIILVAIGAIGSFMLIKKGMNDLTKQPVRTTALTQEGEYILVKQFNETFKDSPERYSDIGDVIAIKKGDIVVKSVVLEVPAERTIRIARDAMIEKITSTGDGQFREDVNISDIKAGDRLMYYYVGKTDPIVVQAVQILGNFSHITPPLQ